MSKKNQPEYILHAYALSLGYYPVAKRLQRELELRNQLDLQRRVGAAGLRAVARMNQKVSQQPRTKTQKRKSRTSPSPANGRKLTGANLYPEQTLIRDWVSVL